AEVQCDHRIQDSDRVQSGNLLQPLDLPAGSAINRDAVGFAHAVDNDRETLVKAGGEISAGGVSQVMIYVMDASMIEAGEVAIDQREHCVPRENLVVLNSGQRIQRKRFSKRRVIEPMRNFVDVAER